MSHRDDLQEVQTERVKGGGGGGGGAAQQQVAHLAEGHLLLTDGAAVAQELQRRREIPVELHGLHNIGQGEAVARRGHQQQEVPGSVRGKQGRHLKGDRQRGCWVLREAGHPPLKTAVLVTFRCSSLAPGWGWTFSGPPGGFSSAGPESGAFWSSLVAPGGVCESP